MHVPQAWSAFPSRGFVDFLVAQVSRFGVSASTAQPARHTEQLMHFRLILLSQSSQNTAEHFFYPRSTAQCFGSEISKYRDRVGGT